jgi:chromosome partitioning protein
LQGVLDAARSQSVDLVLIDTAAKTENDTLLAIEAADLVVIPCRPSAMDLRAIMNTVRLCRTRNIKPHVVLTQIEPQGTAAEEAREALKKLGIGAVPVGLGRRQAFVHSINDGRGVAEYEPRGRAAQEVSGLLDFLLSERRRQARKQSSRQSPVHA